MTGPLHPERNPVEQEAAGPGRHAADPGAVPLRLEMLSGHFVGRRDAATEDALAGFLGGDAPGLLDTWFGADRATRLRLDGDALRCAIDRDIAAIDALVSAQLDAILHHTRMRRLEGSWRGLAWLVDGADLSTRIKIKVLNIGWAEICRDLERAIEFDQSQLFQKVYEEEFGTPGGEPYGLLVVDHEVRHRPGPGHPTDDVTALAGLSGVAAAAFAPAVLSASPSLLEVDSFADLAPVADVAPALRNPDHVRWRGLAGRPDMRFVGLTLPRLLARAPWEDDGTRTDLFRYAEAAPDRDARVWMGAGYAFAAIVVRAFAAFAWPADVRGVEIDRTGGGLVDGLPVEPFRTDPDRVWVRPSIEVVLTGRQERALLEAGLMPVTALQFTEELAFGAVRALLAPPRHQGATATAADANERLSVQMNSILCASRFAHHLKMKGRDMVGSFKTADEIQRFLQAWLMQYVNANLTASSDARAKFPLVSGRVAVQEVPGKPGSFGCTVHLQPHYQLDDVSASFQLVTELGGR
jgi:type VI secretion system ImpC/EvpB family protein